MTKGNFKKLVSRNLAGKVAAFSMAAMIAAGGVFTMQQSKSQVPELTEFVDHHGEQVVIDDGSVPLGGAPKVTKSTKTKKKTVIMKKAAKKTYKKKNLKTKTSNKEGNGVMVETVVQTLKTQKFKKNSKKKVIITKITTTTTTTLAESAVQAQAAEDNTAKSSSSEISALAPKLNGAVMAAYNDLGFTVNVDPSVSYSGYFNSRTRSITLKRESDVIYHELGHFLAFVAGNVDMQPDFRSVYEAEKNSYSGTNKAYVIQNSSEYFAESFRDYTLDPAGLKQSRPRTFAAIESAIGNVTQQQISQIQSAYAPIWG
ncbi:MAG: hypothetical protein Q4D60_02410 [Eubacteriales bacterium]|nr:hypothetical protein [Eubacteriales bacterium]